MKNSCKLSDSCGIFKLVIDSLPVGLIVFDSSGRIIEVNPAAEKLSGYCRNELLGRCCSELGDGLFDMLTDVENFVHAPSYDSKGNATGREATLVNKEGVRIPVLYFDTELKDENNRICGLVKMFRNISVEKRIHRKHKILISMFAHDLKAPVAIAGGFINRLLMGKAGSLTAKQLEYLNVVENELKKLDHHLHAFLDILRIEAGEIKLSLEKCSLEKIIYDVVKEFEEQASTKGITLSVSAPEQNPLIMVDREQIQRVLVNLIDNAIKYSPSNSKVEITVEDFDKYIACRVKDSGPGIDPEDIPYIFDPFYRASSVESLSDSKGTGIGLAVVKSIVEAHNGKVWVKSKPGKGTTFGFSIPKINGRDCGDTSNNKS